MGFASTYLEKRALFPEIVKEAPSEQTGIIVVIPACNEPGIKTLLDSLLSCDEPECKVEVLIIVNAPENSSPECIENNKITINNIFSWKKENPNSFFRLFAYMAEPIVKAWGVGLARKTGMDEAVRRLSFINRPEGIIISLDADCLVQKNYFVSVSEELLKRKDRTACSIYFEHPLSGNEFPESIYKYITLYELHLRYYFQGLVFSGFPYVFHTVGSAFATKALQYVKAGGMNRRQAGEDFYFIQKLVSDKSYFSLNSTTVFPSPRVSSRVPFGTGAAMGMLSEGNLPALLTYNMLAFKELRSFFDMTESVYYCKYESLNDIYEQVPGGIRLFIDKKEWTEKLIEIKNNTSSPESFKKRFFGWFNMFRIIKYLNHVHSGYFEKKTVDVAATELLESISVGFDSKLPVDLLILYRALEKNT
jgi:hypothetical protein